MHFLSKTKMAKIKTEENSQFNFFYLKHSKTKWENATKKVHQYTLDVLTSTVFFSEMLGLPLILACGSFLVVTPWDMLVDMEGGLLISRLSPLNLNKF